MKRINNDKNEGQVKKNDIVNRKEGFKPNTCHSKKKNYNEIAKKYENNFNDQEKIISNSGHEEYRQKS